ncbi:MAG: LytTR family transcriptional regulator [Rhodobacteraceae bacterium]|nr:LytTR family transcriptional regulator [Paracoccaceae bacterium]
MFRNFRNQILSASPTLHPTGYFAVAGLLAYSGPFGTLGIGGFWFRFLFWGGIVFGALILTRACNAVVERNLADATAILQDALIVVFMGLLLSPFLWIYVDRMSGQMLELDLIVATQYVAVVTAGLCVVRRSWPGGGVPWYVSPLPRAETIEPEVPKPRLADRLPKDFAYPIVRLTVRDHVVEVVSATQTSHLRMRFADATKEMEPIPGFCTHRSHWVATEAVEGVERVSGQIRVRLINGDVVPVSRTYRHNLEAAGFSCPARLSGHGNDDRV